MRLSRENELLEVTYHHFRRRKDMNLDIKTFNSIKDDKNLKANEKYFYMLIVNYANSRGYAYPSYKQLKSDLNTTRNDTVSNLIQSLVDKGYIKYTKGNSSKKANEYVPLKYVTSTKIEPSTKSEHRTSTETEHRTSTETEHPKINKKINKKINILCPSDDEQTQNDFDKVDKYKEVFDHWNKEGVNQTRNITADIKKGIDSALKLKKDDGNKFTLEDIKKSISNYASLYKIGSFTYQWSLKDFLNRTQRDTRTRQLILFSDEGTTYINSKKKLNNTSLSYENFIE